MDLGAALKVQLSFFVERRGMAREEIIFTRVSKKEKKEIMERMKELDMVNLSNYMRLMALKGAIMNVDLSDLNEAVRLMRINSNNLNQYTKKANETGNIYKKEMDILKEQQEDIWEMLKAIAERLSMI